MDDVNFDMLPLLEYPRPGPRRPLSLWKPQKALGFQVLQERARQRQKLKERNARLETWLPSLASLRS